MAMSITLQPSEHLITELEAKGYLHFSNQTEDQLRHLLDTLGKVIYTTDVVVNPEGRGMVTSAHGLDYHTDHHRAKYIAWYCFKQTDQGGHSILMDAEQLFLQLPENYKQQLQAIELFEHKIFPDDKESYPLAAMDEHGKFRFYYSFWLVRNEDKQNPALLEFQKLLSEAKPTTILLQERDILVVDNHRILHGRTPIEGSKDRFLKRFWLEQSPITP